MEVHNGRLGSSLLALHAHLEDEAKKTSHDVSGQKQAFANALQEQLSTRSIRTTDATRASMVRPDGQVKRRKRSYSASDNDDAEMPNVAEALGDGRYTSEALNRTQSAVMMTGALSLHRDKSDDDEDDDY